MHQFCELGESKMRPIPPVECRNLHRFARFTFILVLLPVALSAQKLELRAISSRPEMVTGNDVLIEAYIPSSDSGKHPTITLNGNDVTSVFRLAETTGALRGLVSGPSRQVAARYRSGYCRL
jgi:hypothetical protein